MYERDVGVDPRLLLFVLYSIKPKRCLKELLMFSHGCCYIFLITSRPPEMCNKIVEKNPYTLEFAPDHLRTEEMEMCERVDEYGINTLHFLLDHLKTQGMFDDAVMKDPWSFIYIPDHFKTQEMCDDAMMEDPRLLLFLPDWYVTKELIKI